jgi:hypothetical protein
MYYYVITYIHKYVFIGIIILYVWRYLTWTWEFLWWKFCRNSRNHLIFSQASAAGTAGNCTWHASDDQGQTIWGSWGSTMCVCVYIYIRNYIYTLYNIIYILPVIYIYIGEVWRVQVGLSWLRSWCSTWFCEPGKLTNKLSWGYCMYTSHDVQWKTQPKESQQNIAKQCCLMMSSWQTKILLAASC